MKNDLIQRVTKENCKAFHKDMADKDGMYYCPVCEVPIKEQKPIIIMVQKKVEIIYKEVV
jgi:uncharacterized Zn finger protein (UPF0148 family)